MHQALQVSRFFIHILVLGVGLGVGAFSCLTYSRYNEAVAFAPLARQLDHGGIPATMYPGIVDTAKIHGRVAIFVREITSKSTNTANLYRLRQGISLAIPAAHTPVQTSLFLLVDRIAVDIRSYRPSGEDYQVVLHCTLVDRETSRILSDFAVRGDVPSNRSGLLSLFGFDRYGSDPWPAVQARIARRLVTN
jgi:hypothetical protein